MDRGRRPRHRRGALRRCAPAPRGRAGRRSTGLLCTLISYHGRHRPLGEELASSRALRKRRSRASSRRRRGSRRHRRGGHHRVEEAGDREGDGDVVRESPEEVALDRPQDPAREADRVGGRAEIAGDERQVAGLDRHVRSVPMEMPRSAWASAGASLTPSPITATALPASPGEPAYLAALSPGRPRRGRVRSLPQPRLPVPSPPCRPSGAPVRGRARSSRTASALDGLTVRDDEQRAARRPTRQCRRHRVRPRPRARRRARRRRCRAGSRSPRREERSNSARAVAATACAMGCSLASRLRLRRRTSARVAPFIGTTSTSCMRPR